MNKLSILMLALVLLVGGVAVAQDDMMKAGVTVSGEVEFGTYLLGPDPDDALRPVVDREADGSPVFGDPFVAEYKEYDFDAVLKFNAKADEFNSVYIELADGGPDNPSNVVLEEATLTTEIGAWSGLSALAPVTLTFKTGYYEPEPSEKGTVTALEFEDVLGAGVGKDVGNFDVTVGILELVNLKVGFNLEAPGEESDFDDVDDDPTKLFIGLDTSVDVGVGTVGGALYFSDPNANGSFGEGELGLGASFDLTTIPGITIAVGAQFELRLGASTDDLEQVDDGSGGTIPTNAVARRTSPFSLGAGVSFKNTNVVPVTVGVGLKMEAASQLDDDAGLDQTLGVGIDVGVSDPEGIFGLDIGTVLAFSAPVAGDLSTLDMFDVSGWMKAGAATFRIGYVLLPENGGNLLRDYKGPEFAEGAADAGALYLLAGVEF